MGILPSTYNKIENNNQTLLAVELIKIAEALNVDVCEFFKEKEKEDKIIELFFSLSERSQETALSVLSSLAFQEQKGTSEK